MTGLSKLSVLAGLVLVTVGSFALSGAHSQSVPVTDGFLIAADETGAIHLPEVDYRKQWVALGTWAVAADGEEPGSQGFHMVYTQPESVAAFQRDGVFPDGAVIIKELFETATDDMTTGTVSRAAGTIGWFVMVKDATGRFPDNPIWGDGWGWAFFDAGDPGTTTTTDYQTDCLGCHIPAQDSDWVYVEGYPVLQQD